MTKKEIETRLQEIAARRFALAMADTWTGETYETDAALLKEEKALNNILAGL